MELGLQALLAFTPIALSGVLLVGLGWPAKRAMPLVYVVTALIAFFAWGVSGNRIAAATLEGLIGRAVAADSRPGLVH
jgi:lactate permease